MASLVPGFEHDVFVSYATVDNRPANHGWVSAFVRTLHESLAAMFGRNDPTRIWWDRTSIDEETSLTDQIRTKVEKSVCSVIILSRGYVASKWCGDERRAFFHALAHEAEAQSRLFLVDIGNLEEQHRPPEFSDKRGRHFYVQPPDTTEPGDRQPLGFPVPDPENKGHVEFFARIDQLAKDICARVNKIAGAKPGVPSVKPSSDVTLFVAESSDDVADQREEVARYLSDHFRILPAIDDPLPGRWETWKQSVESGLAESSFFIQVVGQLPGRKIAGSDQKAVLAQFDLAKLAGKRVILWRPETFSPESVSDSRMKELLSAAEYFGPLEEFKSEIKRLATPSKPKPVELPPPESMTSQPRVFINTGIEDNDQAKLLSERLKALGCRCNRPLLEGTPEDLRDDFVRQVQSCDGLIVFYGQIKPVWVRRQFDSMERHLTHRTKNKLRALAICLGSPPKNTDLGIDWPGLEVIDGTSGLVEAQLNHWVATLRNGGGA